MAKRSDASKKLRDELKASQVHNHVPSVDNSVAISKYFGHANTIYAESVQSYKKGEWRYAYVQFYIFLEFSFKLRKHNAFSLPQHMKTKAWMKRAEASALEMLEIVASRLDEIEDHARASEEEALIDEFFGSDDAETAPLAPPLSLNTSHEVSDSKSDAIPPISPPEICPPSDAPAMNVDDSLIRDANSLVSEFSISNTSSDLPPEVKPVDPSSASLAKAFSLLKTQDAPLDSVPPTLQSAWPAPTGYPTVAESDLLSEEESVIIHFVEQALRERMYRIPVPHKQELFLTLQGCSFPCAKDDFFVSFASFLPFLPPEIQLTRSAIETNRHVTDVLSSLLYSIYIFFGMVSFLAIMVLSCRCFFIHLGVVTGFHPYILQSYFRYFARKKLLALSPGTLCFDPDECCAHFVTKI